MKRFKGMTVGQLLKRMLLLVSVLMTIGYWLFPGQEHYYYFIFGVRLVYSLFWLYWYFGIFYIMHRAIKEQLHFIDEMWRKYRGK